MSKAGKLVVVLGMVLALALSVTPVMAAEADMSGTWDMEVVGDSGSGNPVFELTQDGKKIAGIYRGAFGESKVKGKIKENKFKLNFESSGVDLTYSGTVEGDTCSGKVTFGEFGSGKFSGQRK